MGRIVKYFFATRDYDGVVTLEPNPETGVVEHDEFKWMSVEELSDIRESIVPLSVVRRALSLV